MNLQMDVAEMEEEDIDDEDAYLEDGSGRDGYSEENLMTARRSLASIFGDTEVLEVDATQADESLLVRTCFCCLRLRRACRVPGSQGCVQQRWSLALGKREGSIMLMKANS